LTISTLAGSKPEGLVHRNRNFNYSLQLMQIKSERTQERTQFFRIGSVRQILDRNPIPCGLESHGYQPRVPATEAHRALS